MRSEVKKREAAASWSAIKFQLGELAELLEREDLTELAVNSDGAVWVESSGKARMERLEHNMPEDKRRALIRAVASWANSVCDEDEPEIGAQLPIVGFRFQGQLEPAVEAPQFTIRLGRGYRKTLGAYLSDGELTETQVNLLRRAIHTRENIVIIGGTGSGKTTFINGMLSELGQSCDDRVYLIEDVREIECDVPNKVSVLVNRQTSYDYKRALFVAMRQRPERIIVGELRDGIAAQGLLKAWNTGHPGGLTTIHANSVRGGLERFEQLLGEVSRVSQRRFITSVVDVLVFIEKLRDGDGMRRRVTDVARLESNLDARGEFVLTHHYHTTYQPG